MTLYDAIQAERAKYPADTRSAVMPALRLAQEEYGWLSPDALREVADALDVTPAYCNRSRRSTTSTTSSPSASTIEVCTNVSCAVYGAQQVARGVRGRARLPRRRDERRRRRSQCATIECLGGCGWGTIVAVDDHYRTRCSPTMCPAIVEELR